MTDWKEESLKKKIYRRGGLEPNPPKKSHKKQKKLFRLEYFWLESSDSKVYFKYFRHPSGWYCWGNYAKPEDAIKAVKNQVQKNMYDKWRIVNLKTKEVVWSYDFSLLDN